MTNNFSKPLVGEVGKGKRKVTPPVSLDRPVKQKLHKGEYQTYKLRNDPTDANSPTYELSVAYFSSGTCEEFLIFCKNINKVLRGQSITTGPQQFQVGRTLLDGEALTAFEATANGQANETVANFTLCLNAVRDSVFPRRAVLRQKRYLRRFLRKPPTMTTREYVARINEINAYLPDFPPAVAGGAQPASLPDDEIVDLLEFGVPNAWQRAMIVQDFDPLQHTVQEFVQFCERMEQLESTEGRSPPQKPPAQPSNKNKRRREKDDPSSRTKPSGEKSKKYCLLHGEGNHSTDDCHTLKAQAKRMKATYEAQTPEKKKSYRQKEELHAIVAAQVEKSLASLQKASKKRKTSDTGEIKAFSELSISSSSGSESDDSSAISAPAREIEKKE